MKEHKLIALIDFVLGIEQIMPFEPLKEAVATYIERFWLINKFANFLKQPPTINMFVPAKKVDGVWVVLEEPKDYKDILSQGSRVYHYDDIKKAEEYQEAQSRVIFEGFEISYQDKYKTVLSFENCRVCFGSKNIFLGKHKDNRIYNSKIITTIEPLTEFNLTLTEAIAKKLGV
jgi:hypothetical protein